MLILLLVSYYYPHLKHSITWTFKLQTLILQIRQELEENGINIYEFPDCDSDEDEEFKAQDAEMKVRISLTTIGHWMSGIIWKGDGSLRLMSPIGVFPLA